MQDIAAAEISDLFGGYPRLWTLLVGHSFYTKRGKRFGNLIEVETSHDNRTALHFRRGFPNGPSFYEIKPLPSFIEEDCVVSLPDSELKALSAEVRRVERLKLHAPGLLVECEAEADRLRQENLLAYLSERRIEYLYHFTPQSNLSQILKCGLYPRERFGDLPRVPNSLLGRRLDGQDGAVSVSISHPAPVAFNAKRRKHPTQWAVLQLKAALLADKPAVLMVSTGASPFTPRLGFLSRRLTKPMLEQAFYNLPYPDLREGIPQSHPTNSNTEVAIFGVIEPCNITEIGFYSLPKDAELARLRSSSSSSMDARFAERPELFRRPQWEKPSLFEQFGWPHRRRY